MEKAVVTMSEWELSVYNETYNLSGIADMHPRLGRNSYVRRTSYLKNYSFENDVLTYETRNTIYQCPLKYMDTESYSNVVPEYMEKLVHRDEVSDNVLDKIISAAAKIAMGKNLDDEFAAHILKLTEDGKKEIETKKKADDDRMIEIARKYEDCVYIEVSSVNDGDKLAYHLGDACGTVEPSLHTGMFQDSVLYMKYRTKEDDTALDFRYFPRGMGNCMDTYSWSDNIKLAVIKNTRDFGIEFNGQSVAPGETKVFTPKEHKQGLFSPDCYNGKSIFLDALQKKDGKND